MKFRNYSQVLLAAVVSLGLVFGLSSCTSSYTIGYLYVVGTTSSAQQNSPSGSFTGFKIDNNTGKLTQINGLPGTGGSNPVRAVIPVPNLYVYVLNQGIKNSTTGNYDGANITQFSIGGNGLLFSVNAQYMTQGLNPTRLVADPSGRYLYAMDSKVPACDNVNTGDGDITVFSVSQTTGRLTVIPNNQLTEPTACAPNNAKNLPLQYFPIPSNPIDMLVSGGYVFTVHGASTFTTLSGTNSYGPGIVYPYRQDTSNGQLVVSQSGPQPTGASAPTALTGAAGGTIYLLDNKSVTIGSTTYLSQILPFSIGTQGALGSVGSGAIGNDMLIPNPTALLVESGGRFVYVTNANDATPNVLQPESDITGFVIDSVSHNFTPIASAFATGSGPQCIVEDPSNQYIYTADSNDALVNGRKIDHTSGLLENLNTPVQSYALQGPAAWCMVTSRTN